MFYEMCFPFRTNMERIYVIQNLRQKDVILSEEINQELFETPVIFLFCLNSTIFKKKVNSFILLFILAIFH